MSESQPPFSRAPLRRSYLRARRADTTGQLRECIDVLENPEIIVDEVLESFRAVSRAFDEGVLEPDVLAAQSEQQIAAAVDPEWFYEGRDLSVLGDPCSFTCLSSDVEPIPQRDPDAKEATEGFDFVGITCNARARPVLGIVQSEADASAYPLLLRGLAGLAELAPAIQLERLNHQFFKGALPPEPSFDLLLVTWYYDENADRCPICEFTRDISEVVKRALLEQVEFPKVLNDIVCLRMNPARFDFRLCFDWRV
ncbi:MAG: hypothetical protein GY944_03555 [bacterium]|nr:hypothetical protein [bacterium]